MEVWEAPRTGLAGAKVQVRPEGETVDVRVTGPVKLFTGSMVTVDVAAAPANPATLVGLAATVKSATWNRIDAVV